MMLHLSRLHLQEVIDYDARTYRARRDARRITQIYRYLLPAGNDMQVHAVAVKPDRNGFSVAKEVVRSSVDEHWVYILDVAFNYVAGYSVDWSPQGLGKPPSWGSYNGRWSSNDYDRSSALWKMTTHPVVNPEALERHPRFRYCAWTPACGDILDYLKLYVEHPRIELISKAGAGRFAGSAAFVRALEKDRQLARFFMDRKDEIAAGRHTIPAVLMAHRRGITLAEAANRIAARRLFKGYGLPLHVDATKALDYLNFADRYCCEAVHARYEYCRYLKDCQALGLDITDTKVAFPRNLKKRRAVVRDLVEEQERRRKVELAKKQDARIAAVAARFARLEKTRAAFVVRIPRRSAEFITEGKRLHNCIGDGHYAAKMARGETVLAFIRRAARPGAAFVAVEFDPKKRKVLQCYGAKNSPPPAPALKFVNRLLLKGAA